MSDLQIFKNDDFGEIRTIIEDGEPLFAASDIAKALGYRMASDMTRRIDDEDKGTRSMRTANGNQEMIVVNESGLYASILGSKLESAKKFKHWVTSEVLPAIRKYGVYATDSAIEAIINDPDYGIRLLTSLKEERAARKIAEEKNLLLEAQVAEFEPKANYCDVILQNPEALDVTQIAQDYGMTAVKFNKLLESFDIQYRVNDQWILRGKHQGNGYVKNKTIKRDYMTRSKTFMQWTQKGRFWLYDELKKKGYLPEIEAVDEL